MTRINLIDPSVLTDKHLMAEYRELPRVFTAVNKLVFHRKENERLGDGWRKFMESDQISSSYCLGKGHVKFFYNKLPWLIERYRTIYYELRIKRQFNLDKELSNHILNDAKFLLNSIRLDMIEDWLPSLEEIYLNMARICKRSKIDKVLDELAAE